VRVDRRVELISILQRLGGGPEYRQAPRTPYVAAVDAAFGPFRSHPAVAATTALRAQHGISFDAPMILAVHLDDAFALVNPDELAELDARWQGVDHAAYAALLRDFAEATKFAAFFDAHRAHHDAVAAKLRGVLDAEHPVAWFDGLFGVRTRSRYVVVPGLLTGPASFGVRATLPDGTSELYQILGVTGADGLPVVDADTVALLVHEMAHSYINPVFERHRAAFERSGAALYGLVADRMRAQAYANWMTMINESGVRAVTVLYLRDRKGADAGAAAARAELRHGFAWINELTEVFRKYQRDRARYADLDAYVPQIVAFFDGLVAAYAGALPKQPFVGPVNAGFHGALTVVLPSEPAVAAYARGVHGTLFAKAPIVAASAKTLLETPEHHLIAYGSPTTNPVIASVAEWANWRITGEGIELGVKRFPGQDLVLIACWFRRDDPTRGVVVYAGADPADLVGINSLRHGGDDWLVARKTAKGHEVVARGNWQLSNGAWVPPY
ncbi:MAG: DUF4932 domain-containing protein, partial [Myxococcota bacterium]|nr:DUF4932 domain-containing protein [Myxococcota bacterium]